MTDEPDDDVDPSDWLASQFDSTGEVKPKPAEPTTPPQPASPSPFDELLFPAASTEQPAPPDPDPPAPPAPLPTEPTFQAHPTEPPPFDASIDGATEVLGAQPVGTPDPVDESAATSALDSLFGEDKFQEHEPAPLLPLAPTRIAPVVADDGAVPPDDTLGSAAKIRTPISKNQKILMWIAGALVGVLALIALFLLGMRLSSIFGATPVASPSPTPTPTPTETVVPVGPVEPGAHRWDDLLGGECLEPFASAWENEYSVVDCVEPHAAQMVLKGTFPDDLAAPYPGIEGLQSRINLLCTPPTVIDYAAAGAYPDIQISASFAADEEIWSEGSRDFFCFASRSSGEPMTNSIAVPQVAPVPEPVP